MVQRKTLAAYQGGSKDDEHEHEPTDDVDPIRPPVIVGVVLTCPTCGVEVQVAAKLQARLTKDSDGKGALALRVRAPKAQHVCNQATLGLIEGARER